MPKTSERARWSARRNRLGVGAVLAIGTCVLASCASHAADTSGSSTPAGTKGGTADAGGIALNTSQPVVIERAMAKGGQSTATAAPASPTFATQTGAAGVVPGAPSTGTGGVGAGTDATLDPSGADPSTTLSGFTLKYVQEFTGASLPAGWSAYSGGDNGPQATDSRAHFDPSQCEFSGGEAHFMAMGVDSCGIHYQGAAQEYGAWFARLKADSLPSSAVFTDIFLLWPDRGAWPPEIDIYEDGGDRSKTSATVYNTVGSLCGSSPTPQCLAPYVQSNGPSNGVANDDTEWHTYGVEWTSSGLSWSIDGNVVFTAPATAVKSPAEQPAERMDMDLQVQSLGSGTSTETETMAVDWVEQFSWNG